MKTANHFNLAMLLITLTAGSAGAQSFYYSEGGMFGETDTRTTLVVKPDGSCFLTNEMAQPRKLLEMQLTSWERYSKMADGAGTEDEDASTPAPQSAKPEQKALTDEELKSKIQEMYKQRSDLQEESGLKIERIETSTNTVRLVSSRTFPSLKDLLSENVYGWGPTLLMIQEARFEMDTNRNLRISLTGAKEAERYAKSLSRSWKSGKTHFEWKLVLPGKILSSSLPNSEGNATWITLDAEKPETADAALKLVGTPLLIAAEPGGIKLEEALDTKTLMRNGRGRRKSEPEIPITDAGPGFMAEPVSITLSTVHYFPEGQKYINSRTEASMFGMSSTGTVVSVKLFPPKGRAIKSVSGLRVKSAKDDKGRAISAAAGTDDNEASYSETTYFGSNGSEEGTATRADLRLGLPEPDAKAIDELQGEAVALTIGGWKEMSLTNVTANSTNAMDLSEVLPGAKLIVKKVNGRNQQKTVEATLEGPREVAQLEVKVRLSNPRNGQSSMSERRSTTSGNKTTRNITIQAYEFERGEETKGAPLTLVVRYPQDVKRERFQFKLTALDLL